MENKCLESVVKARKNELRDLYDQMKNCCFLLIHIIYRTSDYGTILTIEYEKPMT